MDITRFSPIGVMDSGVGGLTVACRLRQLMPGEDIVYFGDSANCPYGNRSREDLLRLSGDNVRFLEAKGAKCIVIACNTISSLVREIRSFTALPVFSIVESAGEHIAALGLEKAGLIATVRTVESGIYQKCLADQGSACRIVAAGSPALAGLIDSGCFDTPEVETEIRTQIDSVLARESVDSLILGCTHYPLAESVFRRLYPGLALIDPALAQASSVKKYLDGAELCSDAACGRLSIFCSAGEETYRRVIDMTGLNNASIQRQTLG